MPPVPAHQPEGHDDAEKSVLASMILDPSCVPMVGRALTAASFNRPANALVFAAIQDLALDGSAVDLVTLRARLMSEGTLERVGGVDYLCSLYDWEPSSANAVYYSEIVALQAARAKLRDVAKEIERRSLAHEDPREIATLAETRLIEVQASLRAAKETDWKSDLQDAISYMQACAQGQTRPGSVLTGYPDVDAMTGGLHAGQVVIVAGRTAMGKSAYALNVALNVAAEGGNTVVYALEVVRRQLTLNAICRAARVSTDRIATPHMSDRDLASILNGVEELARFPFALVDDTPLTAEAIWADAKARHARAPLALVVVDYLQLVDGPAKATREQQVAHVSRTMRFMAKDLGVPVIAVAQVNRAVESAQDRRPKLHHLRESGSLENDADVVMLLYRDDYYDAASPKKGILEIYVAKQKVGRTGVVELAFMPQWLRIESLSRHAEQGPQRKDVDG